MTSEIITVPYNLEAEQSVIGGLLLDDDSSDRVHKVLAMLKPESFYIRVHQIIFAEIRQMFRDNKPVDGLTLFDSLESKGLIEQIGGFAYIAQIAKNTPSAANIVAYAASVRESAMERYGIQRMNEATELLYARNGMSATEKYEAIQGIFTQLTDHSKTGSRRGLRSFGDVMEDWVTDLEKRFDPSGEQRGMSTGIPSLDRMLAPKGLVKGSLFVIGARPKMGKAMALDAKILLQDGSWTTHGEIKVGQQVASVDGRASMVTGVFPQGVRKMYQVTFEDGRTVKAADSHLWEIPEHYHTQVETMVMQSVSRGRDLGYLTDELVKRYGITRRRAETIARDQNAKATSVIQSVRQRNLGITHGIWRHSHAGKVPRQSHVKADGKKFELSKGLMIDGKLTFPGQEINCRCTWSIVLPGLD